MLNKVMDQHVITHAADMLAPGLDFANQGNSAEYIKSSKLVRWRAESGDRFSSAARSVRFRLSDTCWLQPGTVRFQATITNKAADTQPSNSINPCAHPLAMFTSAELTLGGQTVERIDNLTALATIIDRLKSGERRMNESIENHPLTAPDHSARASLQGTKSRRLIMELPFGLLRGKQWIPLHLLNNLTIQLTLGDPLDAFNETSNVNFDLSDVSLLGTCLHTDTSLSQTYTQHLERGGLLAMSYSSITSSRHIVNSPDFTLSLSRGLSKLKQAYFVICKIGEKASRDHTSSLTNDVSDSNMEFHFEVGSSKYPDNACIGTQESFLRLKQAMGHMHDHQSISIRPSDYVLKQSTFGIDFERCGNEASYTGLSTRNGSVMTLQVKNSQATAADVCQCFVYLVYDGIVNIRAGGAIDVLE
jgi:hypothetical protein